MNDHPKQHSPTPPLADNSTQSDLQRTQDDVRASEEKYATLFNAIDEGFCIIEVLFDEQDKPYDYRFIEANPAFIQQTGLRDAMGKTVRELAPTHEPVWFEIYGRIARTGVAERFENEAKAIGFYYEVYAFRIGQPDQNRVAVLFKDITSRKKAEQELNQQAHFIRSITDTTPAIISITTYPAGDTVFHNRDAYAALGFDADELNKMKREDRLKLVHPEDIKKLKDYYAGFSTATNEEEIRIEYRLKNKSGEWLWLDTRGKVFKRHEDGSVAQLLHIAQDITAPKKAEQELKDSHKLVQRVFDVSLNPIAYHQAVRDAAGNIVDFQFQLENREARNYAVEDRTGKNYSEAYPGIIDSEVFKLYCQVVDTGEELNTEVYLSLNGSGHWFHLLAVKLGDGLVATALDVTDRKKTEQEILRLKDEIAQLAEAKYRTLFNSIDEGFCTYEVFTDENGRVIDLMWFEVNAAFERHIDLADIGGKRLSEIMPDAGPDAFDLVTRVYQTGVPERIENYNASIRALVQLVLLARWRRRQQVHRLCVHGHYRTQTTGTGASVITNPGR